MTPTLVVLVGLGGAAGSALRFGADSWLRPLFAGAISWPTLIINVSGSLLLGILTGLFAADAPALAILGTGAMGGYTTLSTASVEAATLLLTRRFGLALVYALGTLILSVAGAITGLWVGSSL